MRRPGVICLLVLHLLLGSHLSAYEQRSNYTTTDIHGWRVLLSPRVQADPNLQKSMLGVLSAQLESVARRVRPSELRIMRQTEIWLEVSDPETDRRNIAGHYHPYKAWLLENGYNPDKHRDIELNRRFALEPLTGSMMFHELVHALHDRKFGYDNAEIVALFQHAIRKNPSVQDRCAYRTAPYFQLNPAEYFATFAEAYFAPICAFPYDRDTLREVDPRSFDFLQSVFGDL